MAVSAKGKRRLTFEGKLYYWYVAEDRDSADYLLHIVSEDKKLVLEYRVDQISDAFIHPKLRVVASPDMKPGIYAFFPPLPDETVTSTTVAAVLNWYSEQLG